MDERLDDDVFGELTYGPGDSDEYGFWYGSRLLPLLGQGVPIILEAVPQQNPTKRQKQVYQDFSEHQMDLKAELQEALFAHYQGVRPWHLGFPVPYADEDKDVPELSRLDQIWGLLTPKSVLISLKPSFLSESNEDLAISWHTTWDTEMFLHANFRGMSLISVDQD